MANPFEDVENLLQRDLIEKSEGKYNYQYKSAPFLYSDEAF